MLALRYLGKAFILIWPFLKNVIFKDRTIREVINDNRQFTVMFGLLVILMSTLMLTSSYLADTKADLQKASVKIEFLLSQLEMDVGDRQCVQTVPVVVIEECENGSPDRDGLFDILY